MAQIQSLKLFSQCVTHYGQLRQWHDNVAIGLDDIKSKAIEQMTAGIQTDAGVVSCSDENIAELSKFWGESHEQELKSVWNSFEWDMKAFKDASVMFIAEGSSGYGAPPYRNWGEAMQWLGRFELALMQKIKQENENSEEKE